MLENKSAAAGQEPAQAESRGQKHPGSNSQVVIKLPPDLYEKISAKPDLPPGWKWGQLICAGMVVLFIVIFAIWGTYLAFSEVPEPASTGSAVTQHPWFFLEHKGVVKLLSTSPGLVAQAETPLDQLMTVAQQKQLLGYPRNKRGSTAAPSKQIIEAHGLTYMRNIMGVSCLLFSATFFLYLSQWKISRPDLYGPHTMACILAFYHGIQACLSISGDYIFSENENGCPKLRSWSNFIDTMFAYFASFAQIGAFIWMLRSKMMPNLSAIALAIGTIAILCKLVGANGHTKAYWDTCPMSWTTASLDQTPGNCRWTSNDYRNCFDFQLRDRRELQRLHIWYQLFYHCLWHLFASLATSLQVWVLLQHPLQVRKRQEAFSFKVSEGSGKGLQLSDISEKDPDGFSV